MSYLSRLPRRLVVVYLPLAVFVFVLLFPFYWMAITAMKPNSQLTDYDNYSPFWVVGPTLEHIKYLLFETSYPGWLWNTHADLDRLDLPVARSPRSSPPMRSSACASPGARHVGLLIFLAYLVPPSILFIPLAFIVFNLGIYDTPLGADLHLSDLPDPVLHLAADGLFPLDPLRARGKRAGRRRHRAGRS